MAAAITDLIDRVTDSTTGRPVISALASPGKAIAAASVNITDATNWTTTTAIHFSIYNTMVVAGVTVKDPTTQTDWKGVLSGTTISNLTLTGGTDRTYTAGAIIELTPTARLQKDIYDLLISFANQDGSLKAAAVQTALGLGASTLNGYNALGYTPGTVTANGNRSYDLVFSGVDLSGTGLAILAAGMRLRTTRTVSAPTQSTSLNGTNQYWSKAAPAGMTFTDDFVAGAWVKLNSYPTTNPGGIITRMDGTSGWELRVQTDGRLLLVGYNAGTANFSFVWSYQSLPLNKWVYVTSQLDMSAFTATTTTSYVMFDGVDVPATVSRGGTNPVALVQAGALEVGRATSAAGYFPGKIAQAFVSSAKITQANVRTLISQGLTSALVTANSIASAYAFNGNATDINTTSANDLTSNNGVAATNADSPFGTQADGTISATLDYAIVQKVTFSTNTTVTVQVPEGCSIPTSGGVASVAYSSNKAPYGFPTQTTKWSIQTVSKVQTLQSAPVAGTWYNTVTTNGQVQMNIPAGEWNISYQTILYCTRASGSADISATLSTANNTESDPTFTSNVSINPVTDALGSVQVRQPKSLAAATQHYLNIKTGAAGLNGIYLRGELAPVIVTAENAFL